MANEPDLMNPPAGPASDTVAIPNDAPEAKIPDAPGAPAPGGDMPPEPPTSAEGEAPAPGDEEPASEGALPTDQSQWEQTTIVEGLGTPDEHQDQFWRHGNFGIELDQSGAYEAYAIVDETPVMLDGSPYESFEEAVAGINEELSHKSLGSEGGAADAEKLPVEKGAAEESGDESAESTPDVSGSAPSEEPKGEAPAPKKDKPAPKEDKPASKEDKKESDSKDKKDDKKEDTKPSKKSVSGVEDTDSIRSMIGAYWHSKMTGVNNLPHTSRSLRDVAKSQNRTAAVGGVTVRIGCDRDAIDMVPGKANRNDGSYKHVDPAVRNAMAPVKGKTMATKATSVDALYGKNNLGHAKTGVKPAKDVY